MNQPKEVVDVQMPNTLKPDLKDKSFKNFKGFTDSNDEFFNGVKEMLAQGTIAKKTAQLIKTELEKTTDPLQYCTSWKSIFDMWPLKERRKCQEISKT
jgi:hypothetical protein